MSGYDDRGDEPPVVREPVRRDPEASLRGAHDPAYVVYEPVTADGSPRPRALSRGRFYAVTLLAGPVVFAALVYGVGLLIGVGAHAFWRAIMTGWGAL